jgi:hypothetical protein
MKLTVLQKRFLTIWTIFHVFALFVNLAKIEGNFSGDKDYTDGHVNLLTSGTYLDKFWPLTPFYEVEKEKPAYFNDLAESGREPKEWTYFYGIFNSYGITEFIFYMAIGIGCVLVPKLWGLPLI